MIIRKLISPVPGMARLTGDLPGLLLRKRRKSEGKVVVPDPSING